MPKGIPGSLNVGSLTIDFYEIKESDGPSPRGINVTLTGVDKSKFDFYPITPNPHPNPAYNKNQKNFYEAAAKFIADGFSFDASDLACPYASIPKNPQPAEMNKILANELGKKISTKKWTEIGKESDQKAFFAAYNKALAEWKATAEKAQKAKAWTAHIKTKSGKTFAWSSITYKLAAPVAI